MLFVKDPDSVLDYSVDWSEWLDTDTIESSTWNAPDDLTIANDSHTSTKTTVWLSGGETGKTYEVKNSITTANSRSDDRTIQIYIQEK